MMLNVWRKTPGNTGFVKASRIGELKLLYELKIGNAIYSTPVSTDKNIVLLVLETSSAALKAIDVSTGQLSWEYPVSYYPPCYWLSVAYYSGRIYLADRSCVIAISDVDGREVQRKATGTSWAPTSSLMVDGTRMYVASNLSRVHAYDLVSLDEVWSFHVGDEVIYSCPCVHEDSVIFASCGRGGNRPGTLFCLNRQDGKEKWRVKGRDIIRTSVAALDGRAFVRSGVMCQTIEAVEIATGLRIWTREFDIAGTPRYLLNVESSPAVDNGVVLSCTVDGRVYALNAFDGQTIWSHTIASAIETSPVIAGECAFVCTNDGEITAWDLKSGRMVWSYSALVGIYSSVEIVSSRLVIATTDGGLLVFLCQENQALHYGV